MLAELLLLMAGPVSKWDERPADLDYSTATNIFEIERCLIDFEKLPAPQVYRQPDRPDFVRLLYLLPNGTTAGRVDLTKTATGAHVKAWKFERAVEKCAPKA